MKLLILFFGLIALCTAVPTPESHVDLTERKPGPVGPSALDAHLVARDSSLASRAATGVMTRDIDPAGATCDLCRSRYLTCVKLSFSYGLPACEEICRQRQRQWAPDVCTKCEDKTYEGFQYREPPILEQRE
ncbi:hypothetical protein M011DRAFT_472513 [Sporormia fimetaria CBS 119925]|uniref:Uncharacterized protein n=1 Tax=Sporormia fimetaria CBS 119925 TaxID=1340428 RepID=A0A6A6UV16_9PLEO|nr:hypothetical protein M011DRAFT_472513 [Sporormia fimetaria CBS 119925]